MSVLLSVTAAQSLTQMMFDFVFSLPSAAETEPSLGPACSANESAGTKGEGKLCLADSAGDQKSRHCEGIKVSLLQRQPVRQLQA